MASSNTLRVVAAIGLLASLTQAIIMILQLGQTADSPILIVAMVASIVFLVGYCIYFARVTRFNPSTLQKDKYFLLSHLLIATWYFWIALITFLYHLEGYQVMDSLTGSNPVELPAAHNVKVFLAGMFAVTCLSHAVDIYTVIFHTRRIKASVESGIDPLSGSSTDRPRFALLFTVCVDVVMIVMTGVSLSIQGDYGTIVLLIVGVLSLLMQLRHARQAWRTADVELDFHVNGQLLAMQHELFVSTIFLVNFLLLMLHNIGMSLPAIMSDDTTGRGQGALVICSILAYIGIALTSLVLVGLHIALEAPGSHAFDQLNATMNFSGYLAVPVPIHSSYEDMNQSMYAVAVPLD